MPANPCSWTQRGPSGVGGRGPGRGQGRRAACLRALRRALLGPGPLASSGASQRSPARRGAGCSAQLSSDGTWGGTGLARGGRAGAAQARGEEVVGGHELGGPSGAPGLAGALHCQDWGWTRGSKHGDSVSGGRQAPGRASGWTGGEAGEVPGLPGPLRHLTRVWG